MSIKPEGRGCVHLTSNTHTRTHTCACSQRTNAVYYISACAGRLSSSEPNLQNVPKQESVRFGNRTDMTKEINVRNAFLPRQQKLLLSIDYVQVSMLLSACLAGRQRAREKLSTCSRAWAAGPPSAGHVVDSGSHPMASVCQRQAPALLSTGSDI